MGATSLAESRTKTARIQSPLRHVDPEVVAEGVRTETRNREVHLPPVSIYRWWARRTESVNGAVLDALALDRPAAQLLIADPFAGGGVIPLAAVIRGHRVYAQDLNPWAAHGLAAMLGLPTPSAISEAGERLDELAKATLAEAYDTTLSDGQAAAVSHTFRVAVAACTACGHRQRLFPHALVSLVRRKERGQPEAFLACPAGHVFEGTHDRVHSCPECGRETDPSAAYTPQRTVTCLECDSRERLERRAADGAWVWEAVLIERAGGRQRELGLPTAAEIAQADERWEPAITLGAIPDGQETRVLTRHGFRHWHDLYPARQRVVLERLLALAPEATNDERVLRALRLAIIGSAEMAGNLSRWDRYYLKSYESMAGHRFNFTTFTAEPNVWGVAAAGRGTVSRRIQSFARAAEWLHARVGRDLIVDGPLDVDAGRRDRITAKVDVRVAEGTSEKQLLAAEHVDLVLTDPPYHDDVQYSELSLPLRAWAGLSLDELGGEALVNTASGHNVDEGAYEELLEGIFVESRRVMKPGSHLMFSYANREPEAWTALFKALDRAGFQAVGYQLLHSENETDYAKRDVRACTLDLLMDLTPTDESIEVEQWRPRHLPNTDEGAFLGIVAGTFSQIGSLDSDWEAAFEERLCASAFLASA